MKRLLTTILLAALFPVCQAVAAPEPAELYILGGQSNMQGIASLKDLGPEELEPPQGVRFWNGSAFEALVPNTTMTAGRAGEFGPEIALARSLAARPEKRPLVLVKTHFSGMPLHPGWNGGTWIGGGPAPKRTNFYPGTTPQDANTGTLYLRLLENTRKAMAMLRAEGRPFEVKGFVWMQGEQDAKNEISAREYPAMLKLLRNRLAEDLGLKRLPMVYGQVLPHTPALPKFTHRELIRQRMAEADSRSGDPAAIPDARMVSTDGFGLLPDTVHYNAAGQTALGRAFAGKLTELCAQGPHGARAASGIRRPNILFFLVDDMGWQETSVPFHSQPTALNRRYQTPNMERLAAQGVKFTQAYASAVCSPSRVSAFTGMNAARHRVTNWTLRRNASPDSPDKTLAPPPWNVNGICAEDGVGRTTRVTALPALLREAGYRTIHVGKAHFAAKDTPGEDPLHFGFDVNIAGHAAGGPGSYWGEKNFSAAWRTHPPDTIWDVPGLEAYHGKDIYLTEALTREAAREMERSVADGKPFYLYMSHYAIHAPWEKDPRFYQKYADAGLRPAEATLASMIEGMDKSLGDLMAAIDRLGVAQDTVILFMSDNGSPAECPRNLPLRGHKLTPYEGGIREPMIVKWPGVTKPGSVRSDTVVIEDFFPTILEIAGAGWQGKTVQDVDGISFLPMLKGQGGTSPERALVWHFPHSYSGQKAYSAIRQGPWKLICHHADKRLELFNIADDIGETRNLAGEFPDRVASLAKLLGERLEAMHGQMPLQKATGKPLPYPGASDNP